MGLDYTDGCVNFRDVGEFLELVAGKDIFPKNMLLRGGSTEYVEDAKEIGSPKTILNLRNGDDYNLFEADYYHFPMSNKIEKYDTSQKEVRQWLNNIVRVFENPYLKFPVFVHCLSGKDRTGIVIAALLLIMGVREEYIIEEYLLSDGEVKRERIELSLNGIRDLDKFFKNTDLVAVRKNLQKYH